MANSYSSQMLSLVKEGKVPLEALRDEEFIMPMPGYDGEVRFILNKMQRRPHILFSACSDYAIINMVMEGLGVSILPELLFKKTALYGKFLTGCHGKGFYIYRQQYLCVKKRC